MIFSGVLDANGIIGLSKGGGFHLLSSIYAPLFVPTLVRAEVIQQGRGRAGVTELQQALGAWLVEADPDHQLLMRYAALRSPADRSVLALAQERGVDHILTDDGPVRREAAQHGLRCLRAPEVVVLMKDQGLIAAVKPVLDRMRQEGFGIAEAVYQGALRAAGE